MTDKKPKRPSKGRVFQCTGFPNCNKSFTRSEHLARHRRKHTGERPFTCSHCSKNFSRLDNLRQHKQTVHAYENYIKRRAEAHKEESASSTDSATDENQRQKIVDDVKPTVQPSAREHSTNHTAPLHQHLPPPPQQVYTPHAGHPLVSPPASGSPPYGPVYYSSPYYASAAPQPPGMASGALTSLNNHSLGQNASTSSRSGALRTLRDPPKFNPKSRPRPLSLVHSFTDDTFLPSHPRGDFLHPLANEPPPLRTAPPVASVAGASGVPIWSHLPAPASSRFAYLTPTMVSPLSPLFHQSFNQVAGSKALAGSAVGAAALTSLANGGENGAGAESNDPTATNISKAVSLPPARLPPSSGKGWLRSMLNEERPPRVAIDSLIEPTEASSSE